MVSSDSGDEGFRMFAGQARWNCVMLALDLGAKLSRRLGSMWGNVAPL